MLVDGDDGGECWRRKVLDESDDGEEEARC